jgi:hypothetical protein
MIMGTRLRKIKTRRWTFTCCKRGSLCPSKVRSVLTQSPRWNLDEMRKDFAWRGLSSLDETMVRERCLEKGVEAPDLATVKDFLRFYVFISRGKIVKESTDDSVNTFAEWFFAGFICVIGTPTDAEERSEVYNVNYQRYVGEAISLIFLSGCERF